MKKHNKRNCKDSWHLQVMASVAKMFQFVSKMLSFCYNLSARNYSCWGYTFLGFPIVTKSRGNALKLLLFGVKRKKWVQKMCGYSDILVQKLSIYFVSKRTSAPFKNLLEILESLHNRQTSLRPLLVLCLHPTEMLVWCLSVWCWYWLKLI